MSTVRGKATLPMGPFVQGLNLLNRFYATRLAENELAYLKNMDCSQDVVKTRRGFRHVVNDGGDLYSIPAGATSYKLKVLGQQYEPDTGYLYTWVGKQYSKSTVPQLTYTQLYYSNSGNTASSWVKPAWVATDPFIGGPMPAGVVGGAHVQIIFYNGTFYIPPASLADIGPLVNNLMLTSSDFRFVAPNNFNTDSGEIFTKKAFIWKDRLWSIGNRSSVSTDVSTNNVVFYSKATDPLVVAAPDGGFFKLASDPKEQTEITDFIIDNDDMYLFKKNRCYRFTYTDDPGVDGYLRLISPSIGAFTSVQYNNITYVVNELGVFAFSNGYFTNVSAQMDFDFKLDNPASFSLSIVNDVLILCKTDGLINALFDSFAMDVKTGAWSGYDFGEGGPGAFDSQHIGPWGKSSKTFDTGNRRIFYGNNRTTLNYTVEETIFGGLTPTSADLRSNGHWYSPEYSLNTKTYDLGEPSTFKKIYTVEAIGYSTLVAADADILWRAKINRMDGTLVGTVGGTQQVKTNLPGVLPLPPFRAKLFGIDFYKAPTDLGAVEPPDFYFQFFNFVIHVAASSRLKVEV